VDREVHATAGQEAGATFLALHPGITFRLLPMLRSLRYISEKTRLLGAAGQEIFHEAGVEVTGAEGGVAEDFLVHGDGGLDALDDELAEGALHFGDGFGAVVAMDDELGDERIVVGRDDALGVLRGIDADAVAAGDVEGGDLASRGGELDRMLGVDAALDGVAAARSCRAECFRALRPRR